MRRVLDVGNCGPDHASIRRCLTSSFEVDIARAHGLSDTLQQLRENQFDLVLINRKLDQDYSDGIEILKQIKADAELSEIPVMLVTNLEEHQELAMSAGAIRGFGKLALDAPETRQRLAEFLS